MNGVEFIFELKRYGIKSGFDRINRLLDFLGNPHRDIESVQIGGTNGKGSVARMVESCLISEGYSVGLYISPHMVDLGERVRVDGEKMRYKRIDDFVEKIRPLIEDMIEEGDPPTFFEVVTAMAFDEFSRRQVDIGIYEVGLGGRLDSTSVCFPSISAITSIGRDHTHILGNKPSDIAGEIGEIIPEDGVCVTGATEGLDVLKKISEERNSDLITVGNKGDVEYEIKQYSDYGQGIELSGRYWDDSFVFNIPLFGRHQARNAAVASGVLEDLDYNVSRNSFVNGMKKAYWPCRFEVVQRDPTIILDAAHNPPAIDVLIDTLKERFDWNSLHLVFGVLCDKDIGEMVRKLDSISNYVYTVPPQSPRAESSEILSNIFTEASSFESVSDGVLDAVSSMKQDDIAVITGSLYVASEARKIWNPRIFIKDKNKAHFKGITQKEYRKLEGVVETNGGSIDMESEGGHEGFYIDSIVESLNLDDILDDLDLYTNLDRDIDFGGTDVMGILNITPDSFYDGGRYFSVEDAIDRAQKMVEKGVGIIDVGGESTRPGADPVSVEEEKQRIIPVLEELVDIDAKFSIDTRKPEIAKAALDAGFDIINDQNGLEDPDMRKLAAQRSCRVVVMDSVNLPVDPSYTPEYDDIVEDVGERLLEMALRARKSGIDKDKIILDPGIGFGKGRTGDAELLKRTSELASLGYPLLVGCSRKSFLKELTGLDKKERLEPSLAANVIASIRGADIVRVHDIEETIKAISVANSLK